MPLPRNSEHDQAGVGNMSWHATDQRGTRREFDTRHPLLPHRVLSSSRSRRRAKRSASRGHRDPRIETRRPNRRTRLGSELPTPPMCPSPRRGIAYIGALGRRRHYRRNRIDTERRLVLGRTVASGAFMEFCRGRWCRPHVEPRVVQGPHKRVCLGRASSNRYLSKPFTLAFLLHSRASSFAALRSYTHDSGHRVFPPRP